MIFWLIALIGWLAISIVANAQMNIKTCTAHIASSVVAPPTNFMAGNDEHGAACKGSKKYPPVFV